MSKKHKNVRKPIDLGDLMKEITSLTLEGKYVQAAWLLRVVKNTPLYISDTELEMFKHMFFLGAETMLNMMVNPPPQILGGRTPQDVLKLTIAELSMFSVTAAVRAENYRLKKMKEAEAENNNRTP